MLSMFDAVIGFLTIRTDRRSRMTREQRYVENYLAKSTDLVDLERREKNLSRKGYFY